MKGKETITLKGKDYSVILPLKVFFQIVNKLGPKESYVDPNYPDLVFHMAFNCGVFVTDAAGMQLHVPTDINNFIKTDRKPW